MTPILCLVSFCLLGWVIVLKIEIEELKKYYEPEEEKDDTCTQTSRSGSAKGMRKFEIG